MSVAALSTLFFSLSISASSSPPLIVGFSLPAKLVPELVLFLLRSQASNNKDFLFTPLDSIDDRFS